MEQGLTKNAGEQILIMAQISYEFVRVHPFIDFNGRVSRLLLQFVAMAFGIPFCIVIKGNKKARHRYIEALRRADAIVDFNNINYKHLEPYATLIAMSICEAFEEINTNLSLAGLEPIG